MDAYATSTTDSIAKFGLPAFMEFHKEPGSDVSVIQGSPNFGCDLSILSFLDIVRPKECIT